MTNLSDTFAGHIDQIFEQWKERVRRDRKIESSKDLSETALGNSVPKVLEAMTIALSMTEEDDFEKIVSASLEHGSQRFRVGFDAKEITREYRLLRQIIMSTLEVDLLTLPPPDYHRAFRLIDAIIDEASAQCFNQFAKEQKQTMGRLLQQLVITNQELERLLTLNRDNLSNLAHELKTPLNSIMGYSQLLLREQGAKDGTQASHISHIERVLRASRQLLELVNGALQVSRSQSGHGDLKWGVVQVRPIIDSVIEIVEPLAEAKDLQLTVDYDSIPEEVTTSRTCLRQILTNLLSNAIRYTDEGSVAVMCELLPNNYWAIAVIDTGIGIAPEDYDRAFEPFKRARPNSTTERDGSTGLGLAIVAQLVKALHGTIELESQVGAGSTFRVIFPIHPEYD
ncbi:MAG: sensor histidine kinase [Elainellaceae cyanobacterium]